MMTREDAITELQNYADASWGSLNEAFETAIATLRPVSWEQVKKVWRGEWIDKPTGRYGQWQTWCSVCGKHSGIGGIESNRHRPFCPNCGAPMTDEAVQMVMERMEALKDGKGD